MARLRLRSLWLNIHLWIGLCLFVVFAPLGVTGSMLVFDDQIDKVVNAQRYAVTGPAGLGPQAYLDQAQRAFGARAAAAQLRMPQGPGQPLVVTGVAGAGQLAAYLDPATAKVLDVANPRSGYRAFVHQLHGNLFMGQGGRRLVGWLGAGMLVSSITGLIIWWPRNNAVFKALRWTRSPSGFSNFHHMVGFWLCAPLALLSFSGAAIAFPDVVRAVQGKPAPAAQNAQPQAAQAAPGQQGDQPRRKHRHDDQGRPPQGSGRAAPAAAGRGGQLDPPLLDRRLSADQALATALGVAGANAHLQQLTLPSDGDRPAWRAQFKSQDDQVQVRVDDATGEARVIDQPAQAQGPGRGDPFMRLLRQIHAGDDTSLLWQAIIALTGVAPTLLGITGAVIWLQRRRRKAA